MQICCQATPRGGQELRHVESARRLCKPEEHFRVVHALHFLKSLYRSELNVLSKQHGPVTQFPAIRAQWRAHGKISGLEPPPPLLPEPKTDRHH